MVEKFSDYEGTGFIKEEGKFIFEVTEYELKDSSKGDPMAVFQVKSERGMSTVYRSLAPKARWSYNNFISACLNLTDEQKKTFELDYETIGTQLIGYKFLGTVVKDYYDKVIKVPNDDGTFSETVESKESYKITEVSPL